MCFHVPPRSYQMVNKLRTYFICAIFANNLLDFYQLHIFVMEFTESKLNIEKLLFPDIFYKVCQVYIEAIHVYFKVFNELTQKLEKF